MCFITELSLIRVNILIISIRQAKMVFKYFFLVFSSETVTGTYSVSASVTDTSQTIQVPLTKLPKLVLVTQTNDSYQLEDGYNYLSFLVVGPGGNGARYVSSEGISGAGGGGGGMAYCKNIPYPIPVNNVWRLNITSSYSRIIWENDVVSVTCDKGRSGSAYEGGRGGDVRSSSTWHGGTLYKAGGTGGGGGDYDDYVCGGGAGTSGWGYENRGGTGGDGTVSNKGGGQYKGNYGGPFNGTRVFPIKTVFNGTGKGGDPFNNGGGGGGMVMVLKVVIILLLEMLAMVPVVEEEMEAVLLD